jgi:hypothetical protein
LQIHFYVFCYKNRTDSPQAAHLSAAGVCADEVDAVVSASGEEEEVEV